MSDPVTGEFDEEDETPKVCQRCHDFESWNPLDDGRWVCIGCVFDICDARGREIERLERLERAVARTILALNGEMMPPSVLRIVVALQREMEAARG